MVAEIRKTTEKKKERNLATAPIYKSFIHQELVVHTHTQKNTQKTNLNKLN